jgi:hypothetical protein
VSTSETNSPAKRRVPEHPEAQVECEADDDSDVNGGSDEEVRGTACMRGSLAR